MLIYGENGTDKELVARVLHFDSVKKDGPFIPINCALLKDDRNLKSKIHITPASMDILLSHPWYGNVRELFHFLETALVLSENNTLSKYLINSLFSCSQEKLLHRGQDLSSTSLEFSEIKHI